MHIKRFADLIAEFKILIARNGYRIASNDMSPNNATDRQLRSSNVTTERFQLFTKSIFIACHRLPETSDGASVLNAAYPQKPVSATSKTISLGQQVAALLDSETPVAGVTPAKQSVVMKATLFLSLRRLHSPHFPPARLAIASSISLRVQPPWS